MKLLFICTHNRCRSILCEAITRHMASQHANGSTVEVASAGSQPAGEVHPRTLEALARHGISTQGLRSQSWDDFADFNPDVAITVCDSAAGESCPLWMGRSQKVHWGLSDPSKVTGSEDEVRGAFDRTIEAIQARIAALLALDGTALSGAALADALRDIHHTIGQQEKQ